MPRLTRWVLDAGMVVAVAAVVVLVTDDDETVSVAWIDARVVSDTVVELRYPAEDYRSPSCWESRPDIDYSTEKIEIDLRFERTSDFCTMEGPIGPVAVTITLDEPVDGRDLVHG
ncbi:MAG: hypothetical protein ACXIVQ_08360 [Acidimicrobiales bacterium]